MKNRFLNKHKKQNFNFMMIAIIAALFMYSCSEADDMPDPTKPTKSKLLQEVASDLSGYKIAFGNAENGNIYMMNPDGSNIELLAEAGPVSGYVSWSEDSKYVYYASAKGPAKTAWEAWRVNVKTKKATKISNFNKDVRSLGVSPDNKTLAISVMTGNSNLGGNNEDLTQFSANLYTVPMRVVEEKLAANKQITMDDLTVIQSSPNKDQFWYEEISWNHDKSNPVLAYTRTWKYDEDDVTYTHAYTIKADGSQNTLIRKNTDMGIWNFDNNKIMFLDLSYYDFSDKSVKQVKVTGFDKKVEISGGALSPKGGKYVVFEIGDENRKGGIAKTTEKNNPGVQFKTGKVNIYEPRWSPIPVK